MVIRIEPAVIAIEDGTPYAPVYDDVYHSRAGAIAQARHVFLGGNQLPSRWAGRDHFVVVETGFGLGLNFLTTWAAWQSLPESERCQRLHFVSVEKHPLRKADLSRLLTPYLSELPATLIESLIRQWPTLTEGTHRLTFGDGRIVLTLILGDAESALPQLSARADAIYLDGFSPAKNPNIWSDRVCQALARLSGEGTTLATWSVNGALRRRLSACGFDLSLAPGFAQKREMLTGRCHARRPHSHPPTPLGHALIIGAGLAGAATAERLCSKGWRCTVIESETTANGASGNKSGVLRPLPSVDDNTLSRLIRTGFLSTLARLQQLAEEGHPVEWNPCGVLHLARDAEQAVLMQKALTAHGAPDDFATWANQQEASSHAGLEVSAGGWWFPTAGWVNPSDYCTQLLQASGATLITHTPVASLTRHTDGWAARDTTGAIIAQGDIVVLANATDAPRLGAPFSEAVPIRPARGQTSVFASPPLPAPHVVICRNGYWTPAIHGQSTCGASFIVDDTDLAIRPEEHEENLTVVSGMLQKPLPHLEVTEPGILAGKVGLRPLVPDRLPLVGALPGITPQTDASLSRVARARVPGLFINSGYGARGILLATLCADLIACQISGEPLPLPKDLVRAIDPMRYAHKKTFTEETSNED